MQVVDFTGLMQVWHQVASLASGKSDLMQLDICRFAVRFFKQLASSLWIKSLDNQLASSLLTTCSRLVIIKPKQAMRTHPDIGLMTAR